MLQIIQLVHQSTRDSSQFFLSLDISIKFTPGSGLIRNALIALCSAAECAQIGINMCDMAGCLQGNLTVFPSFRKTALKPIYYFIASRTRLKSELNRLCSLQQLFFFLLKKNVYVSMYVTTTQFTKCSQQKRSTLHCIF